MTKILILLMAAVLSACLPMSRNLSDSVRKANERLMTVEEARHLEATQPERAAQTYRE